MFTNQISLELRSRLASVNKIIDWCEKGLAKAPCGRLRILKQNNAVYFYHVTDNNHRNGVMIDPKNQQLIRSLAQKAYLLSLLRKAREEQRVLNTAITHYHGDSLERAYESYSSERKKLVSPFMLPDEEYKNKWLAQEYRHKPIDDNMPVYETIKGEHVRSKSEQLIADRLYFNGIPYRYEYPLIIGDMTFHPDFTILRMSDRRELYYEHLGKMDNPDYANKNTRRLNIYSNNGLILGDNLFISMETSLYPLDIRTVDRLIKTRFL